MTDAERQQRMLALATSGGVCEICGKPLTVWQGAHRIANTKANREKYGSFVIDHADNVAIVCCLACNDACNIGNNPEKTYELITKIYTKECQKKWGKKWKI